MNLKKLFALSGVLLIACTSAMAAIVDGVRQAPEPVTSPWAVGSEDAPYYLYNTAAKKFFTEGNTWGTRACVGPHASAIKVYFSAENEDFEGNEGDSTYVLNTRTCIRSANYQWKMASAESAGDAIYVDQDKTFGRHEWRIIPTTGNCFRMQNITSIVDEPGVYYMGRADEVEQNFSNAYSGFTDDSQRYPVSAELAEGEGHYIDWALVAPEDYEAVGPALEIFAKAQELKACLDDAKSKGINVATQENVYLNESASIEELEAAIVAVQKAIADALANGASVANPKDMTESISNPNFDDASAKGWSGSSPNMVGSGSHGPANAAEFWNASFNTYQDLAGMPQGVYMLTANAFFRGNWEDHVNHQNYIAYLYGKVDGDTLKTEIVNPWDALNTESMAGTTDFGTEASESSEEHDGETYFIPADPSAARLYFEKGYYQNKVFFALEGSDPIRVGVMKDKVLRSQFDWVVFDNFTLTYYGNAADAYQYWVDQTPRVDYSSAAASEQYLKVYEAAFRVNATNKAEAMAAMSKIQAASDEIAKNSQLWAAVKAKYDEGMAMMGEYQHLMSTSFLGDYLESGIIYDGDEEIETLPVTDILEAEEKAGDYDLSNEELQTIIDRIQNLIDAVKKEYKEALQPGTDVTEFLTNPGFEDGKNGWTIVSNGGGNVQLGGTDANHCFEAWHSTNFDVYQEVKDLPVGVYEISVNGYMRYLDGTDAIKKWDEAPENVPIYVYMNDSKTNFVNWLSYPKPSSFYDEVSGATYLTDSDGVLPEEWNGGSFPDNMIAASAAFADGGYLQSAKCLVSEAGVSRIGVKGTPEAKFWPIFDNFHLVYLGYDIDVVKPLLEEQVAEAQKWESEITTKSAKAAFTKALADANTALSGDNGLVMFKSVSALVKAINAVKDGNALCKNMQETVEAFMTYAEDSSSPLADEAKELGGTIFNKLEACELDEADIEAYKLNLREMRLKMELPADYTEGSADPKDLTAFIQTPNFSKTVEGAETNAIDGWEGSAGYNFGNDDTQRSALALEFYEKEFDMYQDVEGVGTVILPNGNYKVTVNAFERVGNDTPAFLYAVSGDNKVEVELMQHAAGFDPVAGESGPGDMISAAAMFDEGKYLNEVNIAVTDNKLRIGIKHEKKATYDWIIMDNFKLFFYGNDNTGVETVVNLGKPVQVQYFTLDGRRVNAANKGLMIRKTILDNGTVIVRKIQK